MWGLHGVQSSSSALTRDVTDVNATSTASWDLSPAPMTDEAVPAPVPPAAAPTAASRTVSDESSSGASSPGAGAGDQLASLLGSQIWQGGDALSPPSTGGDGVHHPKQSPQYPGAAAPVSATPTAFMAHDTHDAALDVTLDDALFGGHPATSPTTSDSVSGIASSPAPSQSDNHGASHSAGHSPNHSGLDGTNGSRSALIAEQLALRPNASPKTATAGSSVVAAPEASTTETASQARNRRRAVYLRETAAALTCQTAWRASCHRRAARARFTQLTTSVPNAGATATISSAAARAPAPAPAPNAAAANAVPDRIQSGVAMTSMNATSGQDTDAVHSRNTKPSWALSSRVSLSTSSRDTTAGNVAADISVAAPAPSVASPHTSAATPATSDAALLQRMSGLVSRMEQQLREERRRSQAAQQDAKTAKSAREELERVLDARTGQWADSQRAAGECEAVQREQLAALEKQLEDGVLAALAETDRERQRAETAETTAAAARSAEAAAREEARVALTRAAKATEQARAERLNATNEARETVQQLAEDNKSLATLAEQLQSKLRDTQNEAESVVRDCHRLEVENRRLGAAIEPLHADLAAARAAQEEAEATAKNALQSAASAQDEATRACSRQQLLEAESAALRTELEQLHKSLAAARDDATNTHARLQVAVGAGDNALQEVGESQLAHERANNLLARACAERDAALQEAQKLRAELARAAQEHSNDRDRFEGYRNSAATHMQAQALTIRELTGHNTSEYVASSGANGLAGSSVLMPTDAATSAADKAAADAAELARRACEQRVTVAALSHGGSQGMHRRRDVAQHSALTRAQLYAEVQSLRASLTAVRAAVVGLAREMKHSSGVLAGPLVQWVRHAQSSRDSTRAVADDVLRRAQLLERERCALHEALWRAHSDVVLGCQVRTGRQGGDATSKMSQVACRVAAEKETVVLTTRPPGDQIAPIADKNRTTCTFDKVLVAAPGHVQGGGAVSDHGFAVAEAFVRPVINSVIDGHNGCIVSFGELPPPVIIVGGNQAESAMASTNPADASVLGLALTELFHALARKKAASMEGMEDDEVGRSRPSFGLSLVEVSASGEERDLFAATMLTDKAGQWPEEGEHRLDGMARRVSVSRLQEALLALASAMSGRGGDLVESSHLVLSAYISGAAASPSVLQVVELALPTWGASQSLNPQLELMMRALASSRGLSSDSDSTSKTSSEAPGARGLVRAMAPSLASSGPGMQTCKFSIVLVLLDTESSTAAAAARTHAACLIGGRLRAAALGHDLDSQTPSNATTAAKTHARAKTAGFPILVVKSTGVATARNEQTKHALPASRGRRARAVVASMRTPSAYATSRAPRSAPLGAFAPLRNAYAANADADEILAGATTPRASSLEAQMVPPASAAAARMRTNVPTGHTQAMHALPAKNRQRRLHGARVPWSSATNPRGSQADSGWQKPVDWQGGLRG